MPILRLTFPDCSPESTCLLDGARITIGRGADNTIQIAEPSVSAHHAELILVHDHYRLHDLASTNLTCIDGQPISDFHLHSPCRIRFGNVETHFSPETLPDLDAPARNLAPTQSEIDFLKRDNRDLQNALAAVERRLEILGEAPLMPLTREQPMVPAEVHRRILAECDALRRENAALHLEVDNFKCDIDAILRDRDALRQAWATTKADLAGVGS